MIFPVGTFTSVRGPCLLSNLTFHSVSFCKIPFLPNLILPLDLNFLETVGVMLKEKGKVAVQVSVNLQDTKRVVRLSRFPEEREVQTRQDRRTLVSDR